MSEQLLAQREVLSDLVNIDAHGRAHRTDGKFMSNYHVEVIDAYQEEIRAFEGEYQDLKNGVVSAPAAKSVEAPKAQTAKKDRVDVAALQEAPAKPAAAKAAPAENTNVVSIAEKKSFRDKLKESRIGRIGAVAAASLVAVMGLSVANSVGNSEKQAQDIELTSAEEDSTTSTAEEATTTTVAPTTSTTLNEAAYTGESTGLHGANEIGFFDIDPSNPNQSLENLYAELRVNSDAQAFWNACLETGAPSYEACVADPAVLANANRMAAEYRSMTIAQKATTAESLIAKFKKATFNGTTVESGTYKTVAVGSNGEFIASSNTRDNDPRLRFTFKGDDGKDYEVEIRSCVQITDSEVRTPEVTPPAPKPTPKPEQPTTTTTPEDTTTTTKPTTTTTKPTTTTTKPTTTTTKPTTTTTKPTTTTTKPTTTTTEQKNPVPLPTTPEFPDNEPGDPGENPNVPDNGNTGQDEDGYLPGENPNPTTPPTSPEQKPDAPINNPDNPSDGVVPLEAGIGAGGIALALGLVADRRRNLRVTSAPTGMEPIDFNLEDEL